MGFVVYYFFYFYLENQNFGAAMPNITHGANTYDLFQYRGSNKQNLRFPRRAICAVIKTGIEICILFRFWGGLNRGFYSLIRERSSHYLCKDALDQWAMHYLD